MTIAEPKTPVSPLRQMGRIDTGPYSSTVATPQMAKSSLKPTFRGC
jgi:hypothetical protein